MKSTLFYPITRRQVRAWSSPPSKASDFPPSLQKIIGAFQMVPDPMARYKQLLFYATKLTPLPADDHIPSNKVEGCVSQVWVKPDLRDDGKVYWSADSDSQLTKGLAALLVLGLSGCTPQEITRIDPSFIELLGLKQSLTPSRNNGFLNMLKLMQKKAAVIAAAISAIERSEDDMDSLVLGGSSTAVMLVVPEGSMKESMRVKLMNALSPVQLDIEDESAKHAGHAAMAGRGGVGETHFNIRVTSMSFEGMNQVKRHRAIYALLTDEFQRGLHALSLDTKTPSEAGM